MPSSTPSEPAPSAQRAPFMETLRRRWQATGSLLCVGLDPELECIPQAARSTPLDSPDGADEIEATLLSFTQAIVDATAELVCAYKPNSAFYEQYGPAGMRALQRLIAYIHQRHPAIPVLLDAKRGDIGSTSAAYARACFEVMQADAVTLHPYLGREALAPFLARADRGCFILCRTSNPGGDEFQDVVARDTGDTEGAGQPLYQRVAQAVARDWNVQRNCALVVGATYPAELRAVRQLVGDLPILVPGIGAQGGDLAGVVAAGLDSGGHGLLISASRSVLYAASGADFAEAAHNEAARLTHAIAEARG